MTVYTPYPTVTINGTAYSGQAISSIGITLGRRDIMEQPQAGVANIALWTDANTPIPVSLSQPVTITIKDSTGANKTIFGGTVSDIEITLDNFGIVGSIARYSITVIGPLAQLNKRLVGAAGYAKEFDGTRVYNILSEAFLTNWSDVAPTLKWSDLPVTATWNSYDGASISLVTNLSANVDRPGQYELMAYSGGETNALTLAQDAAQSGRGILYESEDGDVHYDDYASRTAETAISLVAGDLNSSGLRTAAQWSEITNDANVSYRAGTETARDEQSIILYGQLTGTRSTSLHNQADALAQATAFIQTRAYPRMYPENLSLSLHNDKITDVTRDKLIGITVSKMVSTTALPAVFGKTFTGYVEGINWQITRYTADLTLTCSAQSENYPHLVWFQIPPTTTWSGYTPSTTKWQDL